MKLFKFKKSVPTTPALPPVEKMDEVEQKLVNSIRREPSEWRISPIPCDEGEERDWFITHNKSAVRIMISEKVAKAAAESNVGAGTATYGGYHFQSEFIRQFGALAYALYQVQHAEDLRRSSLSSYNDLKARVQLWK